MTPDDQHGVLPDQAIAVVGMGLRFPGARTVQEYWDNLRSGVRSINDYDEPSLLAAGVLPSEIADPNYVRSGASISGVDEFDAEFFGFSPKEAAIMDPQHRKFLEVCWEAIEDSTHPPSSFDGPVGVFGGCGMNSYFMFNLLRNPAVRDSVGMFLLRHTGNDKDFLTTRVSFCLNLKGPSVNIQTACSTSLVAIHAAAQSLLAGECDMAIAGGSTIELPHGQGYRYQDGEILSPDGHCRAFDAQSRGTVFGSGAGAVVLRRLEDAVADGDRIYSVIRGSAINNDGSAKAGYLAPSVDQQAAAAAEAMAIAGVGAESIGFVAAHGTGTPIGDPIEVAALSQAFRETTDKDQYCVLGSVKPNIGHLDTAAGVASFIAASLAIHHQQIPPSVDFHSPNPAIDFDNSPFVVSSKVRHWDDSGRLRRAMVHSLGVGGTNANVILESAPIGIPESESHSEQSFNQRYVLAVSAKSVDVLDQQCGELAGFLDHNAAVGLDDVAYSLRVGRESFAHRRVMIARDRDHAIAMLRDGDPQRVVSRRVDPQARSATFLFPGGGCQYVGMGRDLYDAEPVFRDVIDTGCDTLQSLIGVDLRELVMPSDELASEASKELERPAIGLPAIFLWEIATARLWMSRGVQPEAMIGHSMGENTAACLAGVMTFEDALRLVVLRGRLLEKVPAGSMMTINLSAEKTLEILDSDLDIAVVNGPDMCVVSGTDEAIERFSAQVQSLDIEFKRIPIRIAAHSRLLAPVLPEFREFLESISLSPPQIPFVSNRSGTWITDEQATSPDYWCQQLRHTVRFADGIAALADDPTRVFIETGPGKILSAITKQNPAVDSKRVVLSSMRHVDQRINDVDYFLTSLAGLWASGFPLDWDACGLATPGQRISLPTYAFRRDRYWIDPTEDEATQSKPVRQPLVKNPSIDQWLLSEAWQPAETPRPGTASPSSAEDVQSWLIFLDDAGIGQAMADDLRGLNHKVTTVQTGDVFQRVDEDHFVIVAERGIDACRELIDALEASGGLPDRIVYLWPITIDQSYRPGSSFLTRTQEQGVLGLTGLIQAIGNADPDEPVAILAAGNGLVSVDQTPVRSPLKSTLMGPIRVAPREYPNLRTAAIDLELPKDAADRDAIAQTLIQQTDRLRASDEMTGWVKARRGDRWFESVLRPLAEHETTKATTIRRGGTYLITGGFGGIGSRITTLLATKYQCNLVLITRSQMPPRDRWAAPAQHDAKTAARIAKIQAWEQAGGSVLVATADVASEPEMKAAVEAAKHQFGSIDGVFHAAGEIDDQLIAAAEVDSIQRVLSAKVYATLILQDLFRDGELDFLAMCSSTSTVLAPTGQAAYVAANEFLSAFAKSDPFSGASTRTIAIHWGVWKDVGMAAGIARRLSGQAEPDDSWQSMPTDSMFQRVSRTDDGSTRLRLSLNVAEDWVLDQHRTSEGQAVLPGTAYIQWIASAARLVHGEAPIKITNLMFVEPCLVNDQEDVEIQLTITPSVQGHSVEVESRSGKDGAWQVHALGEWSLAKSQPSPMALDEPSIATSNESKTTSTRQAELLRFGPRWDCYQSIDVDMDRSRTSALLCLPQEFADDLSQHPWHPALLDMATGFGLPLVDGYDDRSGLYVPMGYGAIDIFGPLPSQVRSRIQLSKTQDGGLDSPQFDVQITDTSGNVLVVVDRLRMKSVDAKKFAASIKRIRTPNDSQRSVNQTPTSQVLSDDQRLFEESYRCGIEPDEGAEAFESLLTKADSGAVFVSPVDLNDLKQRFDDLRDASTSSMPMFSRPIGSNDLKLPSTPTEKWLAKVWQDLLGIDQVGVDDSFLDLGGHSLLAVRLFAKLRKERGVDLPLATLFDSPTVTTLAKRVDQILGSTSSSGPDDATRPAHRFVVPLFKSKADQTAGKPPLFLVGGMFGNVLNLRYLATRLGADQTVYGIQAKGLIGDDVPHHRFADMAADYLAEIRSIQPSGPYFIGGFSGGGLTAFEMAHQLVDAGEKVGFLALLDTPAIHHEVLSLVDKCKIHWDYFRRSGRKYLSQTRHDRRQWNQTLADESQQRLQSKHSGGAEFRSALIRDAFMEAVADYQAPTYQGRVHLFRPTLDVAHHLAGGRRIRSDRTFLDGQNHWAPYVRGGIEVFEVAGDHDSMVLEPHVRTLASELKRCLIAAQTDQASPSRSDSPADHLRPRGREAELV